MPAADLLDRVNELDEPIGTVHRADVFLVHANFRVVHVFILNSEGGLLLQKLAPSRRRHPGRWGASVAAYVAAGENYAQAAIRRLREELGITGARVGEVGKTQMLDEGCRKFITLFTCRHDGPFEIDPSHIAEVEFLSLRAVREFVAQDPSRFTPTFLRLLDFYSRTSPS